MVESEWQPRDKEREGMKRRLTDGQEEESTGSQKGRMLEEDRKLDRKESRRTTANRNKRERVQKREGSEKKIRLCVANTVHRKT